MVALFFSMLWGGVAATFWAFSYIIKRVSRAWCIRFATILLLVAIILVLLLQDSVDQYYLWLGLAWGLASGVYWCSMHTFAAEAMGGKSMAGFTTWFIAMGAFTRIVFPVTLGSIIEFVGFATAATIATGLAITLLCFTMVLRDPRKTKGAGMSLIKFFKHMRAQKASRALWGQYFVQFCYGLFGVATLCTTILIVVQFQDNFGLGSLTSIGAAIAIAVLMTYKAIKHTRTKSVMLSIASTLPLLATIPLLFALNSFTLVLAVAGFLSFKSPAQAEMERAKLNMMTDFKAEQFHTESLVFIESAYLLARAVGIAIILGIYFSGIYYALQVLLFALIAMVPLSVILLHRWTKKYIVKT